MYSEQSGFVVYSENFVEPQRIDVAITDRSIYTGFLPPWSFFSTDFLPPHVRFATVITPLLLLDCKVK